MQPLSFYNTKQALNNLTTTYSTAVIIIKESCFTKLIIFLESIAGMVAVYVLFSMSDVELETMSISSAAISFIT